MKESIVTHSELETIEAGRQFAQRLQVQDIVALYGDLGSGKTRFVKGIALGLGNPDTITSPTFTIVSELRHGRIPVYHFDCYRIKNISELDEIGYDEYLNDEGICVIEWADIIQDRLTAPRYDIHFSMGEQDSQRIITIQVVQ